MSATNSNRQQYLLIFLLSLLCSFSVALSFTSAASDYSDEAIIAFSFSDASAKGIKYSIFGHNPPIPKPVGNITNWKWWSDGGGTAMPAEPLVSLAIDSTKTVEHPQVAFSREGYALAVWGETEPEGEITCTPPESDPYQLTLLEGDIKYRKWNGTAWEVEKLAVSGNTSLTERRQTIYSTPAIAIDNNGRGLLLYMEQTFTFDGACTTTPIPQRLHYSIWNGTAFQGDFVLFNFGGSGFFTYSNFFGHDLAFTSELAANGSITRQKALAAWYSTSVSNHTKICPGDPPDVPPYPITLARDWVRYAVWNGTSWEKVGELIPDLPIVPPDLSDNITTAHRKLAVSSDQFNNAKVIWSLGKLQGDPCGPINSVLEVWSAKYNITEWKPKAKNFDTEWNPDIAFLPDNTALGVYTSYDVALDLHHIKWSRENESDVWNNKGVMGIGTAPTISSLDHGTTIAVWTHIPSGNVVWTEYNASVQNWLLQTTLAPGFFVQGNELDIAARTGSPKLPHAEWSFSVYQASDGDNAQTDSRNVHANEMKSVGSSNLVNIVRLYDPKKTFSTYSAAHTDYYYMKLNEETRLEHFADLHTGRHPALADFMAYALEEYPAKRHMIITSDHGEAWQGLCVDDGPPRKKLNLTELRLAFSTVNKHYDIIAMHNCFMGTIEAVYEIHEFGDFAAVSPQAHLSKNYGYDKTLRNLTLHPFVTNVQLAKDLVTIDNETVAPVTADWFDTFSAINLSHVPHLVSALNGLALSILANISENISVRTARTGSQAMPEDPVQVDIYNFSAMVYSLVATQAIKNNATKVMEELNKTVVAFWAAKNVPQSHGLNVYFEDNGAVLNLFVNGYNTTRFSLDTKWLPMLQQIAKSSIIRVRLESPDDKVFISVQDAAGNYVGFSEAYGEKDCGTRRIDIPGAQYVERPFDISCNCTPEEIYLPTSVSNFSWFVNGSLLNAPTMYNLSIQVIVNTNVTQQQNVQGTLIPGQVITGQFPEQPITPPQPLLLVQGWNLIAPLVVAASNSNATISLAQGWNLLGHSAINATAWSNAHITQGATSYNLSAAEAASLVQATLYGFNASSQSYFLVPGDDIFLKKQQGYWIYANTPGLTLLIPNSGGIGVAVPWENTFFSDGSTTLSLADAEVAGWLQATIFGFNPVIQVYTLVPNEELNIYPWKGYWLYALQNNITLITN